MRKKLRLPRYLTILAPGTKESGVREIPLKHSFRSLIL